jgi:N-acetyl-anhydromuramyl-L-alanine amidase AmpD
MLIDDKTYSIKEINRYRTQNPKIQIVLATSLRKNDYHITRLLHKDFGKTKKWNTYTISRDGTIYQHYNNKYHTDFLGIKEADKQIISIVLENMGSLFQTPSKKFINWLNEICDDERVVAKNWLGYSYWEQFDGEQIKSLVSLCKNLCEEHNIPKVCVEFHHYHKDIIKFRGIVFRSNYIQDSSDINPLFDIVKFNEMLNNEEII